MHVLVVGRGVFRLSKTLAKVTTLIWSIKQKMHAFKCRNFTRDSLNRYNINSIQGNGYFCSLHYIKIICRTCEIKNIFFLEEVKCHNLAFLSNNICRDPLECILVNNDKGEELTTTLLWQTFSIVRKLYMWWIVSALHLQKQNCRGAVGTDMKRKLTAEDCAPLKRRTKRRCM